MRATQKKMMSKPVTSALVGIEALQFRASRSGQPKVENGHSPDENHVSSTSGSRSRSCADLPLVRSRLAVAVEFAGRAQLSLGS